MLAAIGCSDTATPRSVVAHSAALYANGDFEADAQGGAPSNWTVDTYLNHRVVLQSPQTRAGLALDTSGGRLATRVVKGVTPEIASDDDAPQVRYPRFGTGSALLNYAPPVQGNNQNINGIKQQNVITQADVDPDDNKIHLRFVLAPVMENPQHDVSEQPYYFVQIRNVSRNALLYQEFQVSNQPGVPWQPVSQQDNGLLYTEWQLVDVSPPSTALALGDTIETEVIAAGCSRGQHFGRLYVDAFGAALPGLFTSASAADTVAAGGDLTYAVHYKNGANTPALGARLDFVVPPDTTYVSTTGQNCTAPTAGSTGTVSCTLGDLAAGAHGDFNVVVKVDTTATGRITQGNYFIRATGVSPLLGSHVVTTIPNADLVANVSSGLLRAARGVPIRYTITVTNSGSQPAMGVSVKDSIPPQLTNVTWTCSGTTGAKCAASGMNDIDDKVDLPVGGTVTYVLDGTTSTMTGNAYNATTHTVTASLLLPSGGTISTIANETIELGTVTQITVTKMGGSAGTVISNTPGLSCGAGCTSASGSFVRNSNVTLTAVAPSGGTFDGWGGSCSGMSTTCQLTNIQAGPLNVTAKFTPPTITVVDGSPQQADVTKGFAKDLVVEVKNPGGHAVAGVPVHFTAPSSGASAVLASYDAVTDANGRAKVSASANTLSGAYQVTASIVGSDKNATFMLTNQGGAAVLTAVSGSGQSVTVHEAARDPLVVKVTDTGGTPLAGVDVTFTAASGDASAIIKQSPVKTDASGLARAMFTANDKSGTYAITARVSGVMSGVDFTVTNHPGAAEKIEPMTSSTPQSAHVGSEFGKHLTVIVSDHYGNPVPGVSVAFEVPDAGATATLNASSANTDEHGAVGVVATASAAPGRYRIVARLPNDATAAFELGNTLEEPRITTVSTGGDQSTLATRPLPGPIVLEVRDDKGNLVAGAKITVTVSNDGGVPVEMEVTTDNSGHATVQVTAGTKPGDYTVTFTLDTGEAPTTSMFTVKPIPTTSELTTSSDTVWSGDPVELTATVSSDYGSPIGTVVFEVDGEKVGEAELENGVATYEYTPETAGQKQLTAKFVAQGAYDESSAGPLALEVNTETPGNTAGAPAEAPDAGAGRDMKGWMISGGGCAVSAPSGSAPTLTLLWLLCAATLLVVRRRR